MAYTCPNLEGKESHDQPCPFTLRLDPLIHTPNLPWSVRTLTSYGGSFLHNYISQQAKSRARPQAGQQQPRGDGPEGGGGARRQPARG